MRPQPVHQFPAELIKDYEAQKKLASTPGKATWLAIDRRTGNRVVIKLLFFDEHFDWQHHKLFEREAQVLQTLSHPALPEFITSIDFQDDVHNGFALVQTYKEGTSLAEFLKQGRSFSETELRELAQKVLEILVFLHSRQPPVIHRDIKPSNILLGDRTAHSIGQVFLVDFDAVQTVMTPGRTKTVVGTYGYMPPEQFGGRTVSATDLYGLGATIIFVATGQHPADLPQKRLKIQFEPFVQLNPGFIHWINQMVEPGLDERFRSAEQALLALTQHQHIGIIKTKGTQLANKLRQKKQSDLILQKSEHSFNIKIYSPTYRLSIFTIHASCSFLILAGILLCHINFSTLFLVSIVLWFCVIYIAAVSCAPKTYFSPKLLTEVLWPKLGIYQIKIDPNHLTISFEILGDCEYIEYERSKIASLKLLRHSNPLNSYAMGRPSPHLQHHDVLLALNPFSNLGQASVQQLEQELIDWLEIPPEQ